MAKVNKKNDVKKEVALFNQEKRELIDRINCSADMISLTDLWKEAGSIESKAPKHWLGNDQTKGFLHALCKFQKVTENYLLKIKRGKGGGTYAHKQIALEYAQYLDERLGILVNEVFFQRVE